MHNYNIDNHLSNYGGCDCWTELYYLTLVDNIFELRLRKNDKILAKFKSQEDGVREMCRLIKGGRK